MNCVLNQNEQEELLLGYTTAKLDLETTRAFERHLETCPQCRELVALHRMLDETLEAWHAPEPSANFDAKLFAQIRAEHSRPQVWWRQLADWKILVPVALAATLLVTFLVRSPEPVTVADTIQAEQIEQVERALEDFEALQAISQTDPSLAEKEVL